MRQHIDLASSPELGRMIGSTAPDPGLIDVHLRRIIDALLFPVLELDDGAFTLRVVI